MKVYLVQHDVVWEDEPANLAHVEQLVDATDVEPGSLVVLPEMFATGFSMNAAANASPRPGRFLGDLARVCGAYVIGGVIGHAPDGRGRNEAVICGPDGGELARYCKMHPFSPLDEDAFFEAGRQVVACRVGPFVAAPVVCYDLRFPELFRTAVTGGAELFVVIANWPAARADHWRTLLRARAIENQAYVVGVNRVGGDPNVDYAGGSCVIDPRGQLVAVADETETVLTAEIDPAAVADWRAEFPALRDRQTEHSG